MHVKLCCFAQKGLRSNLIAFKFQNFLGGGEACHHPTCCVFMPTPLTWSLQIWWLQPCSVSIIIFPATPPPKLPPNLNKFYSPEMFLDTEVPWDISWRVPLNFSEGACHMRTVNHIARLGFSSKFLPMQASPPLTTPSLTKKKKTKKLLSQFSSLTTYWIIE